MGQHARINFKAGTSIGLNTRCIWLVECQYSSVSFHLIKSGFNKYGVISINTIDTATGKISNHTNRIEYGNNCFLLELTSHDIISISAHFLQQHHGRRSRIRTLNLDNRNHLYIFDYWIRVGIHRSRRKS